MPQLVAWLEDLTIREEDLTTHVRMPTELVPDEVHQKDAHLLTQNHAQSRVKYQRLRNQKVS